jgi:hypothetical protein
MSTVNSNSKVPSVPKNKNEGEKLATLIEQLKLERLELSRRAKELEAKEKGLKSLLVEYAASRLKIPADKIQPGESVELGAYKIVSKEGRATVSWKEVCEVELGKEFVERMQSNAPRSTSFEIIKI